MLELISDAHVKRKPVITKEIPHKLFNVFHNQQQAYSKGIIKSKHSSSDYGKYASGPIIINIAN